MGAFVGEVTGDSIGIPGPATPARPRSLLPRNAWFTFFLRRALSLIINLLGLTILVFLMVRLIPGDPARVMLGTDATEEQMAQLRHELGLDTPVLQQFLTYLGQLAHGNLGNSYHFHAPVAELLSANAPSSVTLAGVALITVLFVSVPAGMVAAAVTKDGRHQTGETAFTTATSLFGSMPEFLTATFLALIFAVWLRLLPVAGGEGVAGLILPVLALVIRPIAVITRIVRVETLNALHQDYMRTARSKQLPQRILYVRHALPNVLNATLTLGGVLFTALVAGAVVVENVFGRTGVGTLLIESILSRDYPAIQGIMLFLGATVIVVNTAVDTVLALTDPRLLARED